MQFEHAQDLGLLGLMIVLAIGLGGFLIAERAYRAMRRRPAFPVEPARRDHVKSPAALELSLMRDTMEYPPITSHGVELCVRELCRIRGIDPADADGARLARETVLDWLA